MSARILIADDHEVVREGIRTFIAKSRSDWEVCGEATNGEEAVEACKALKPDVIILDITMPRMNGLEAASQITQLGLGSRVLLFTMHASDWLPAEARQTGAQGFVLKSQAGRDLIRAIDCLLAGGTFFGMEASSGSSDELGVQRPLGSDGRGGLCHPLRTLVSPGASRWSLAGRGKKVARRSVVRQEG
jgi:DNA-binding NarL/FixJ family response regulator